MQCLACRAINDEHEERCVRCGRRLHAAAPRRAPEVRTMSGGTIPGLIHGSAAPAYDEFVEDPSAEAPARQPSLFRDWWGGNKVIPIPTLTPLRLPEEDDVQRAPRRTQRPPRRTPLHSSDTQQMAMQQTLEFQELSNPFTPAGESILCDAPVAPPAHRMLAAAFDCSMVLVSVGLFLAVFLLSGGDLVLNRQTVPLLLAVIGVIALFYRFLWAIANSDTPGMRFAGLRLVDFDGRRPDRETRMYRQAASLLSVASAGLGLVWALVDEEQLTWHDRISKSFPTSAE